MMGHTNDSWSSFSHYQRRVFSYISLSFAQCVLQLITFFQHGLPLKFYNIANTDLDIKY